MSASAILKLQKVGFTVEQVEALADLIDTQAASKTDLLETEHRLDTKIMEIKAELKAEIVQTKAELKAEVADTKAELKADNAAMEIRLIRWVVGTGVAGVLALIAANRYLPH